MLVEELTPEAEGEWDAYVEARPDATCYHLRAWRMAAQRAYHLASPFLITRERPGGPLRGALPLFVVKNPLGGYTTTGLFGAYGPILADSGPAREALLQEARRLTIARRLGYLVHKALGDEPMGEDFVCRDHWAIAVLPLEPDADAVWRRFRPEIRNLIRKAQRSGLEVRSGPEELEAYYDVLSENMHRKGTPIYGIGLMRELVRALGDRAEILTLAKDGVVVSGALVVYHKGVTYVPFASSRPSAFQWSPNNLLYWEVIQRSCGRGMRVLDFGRSVRDSTTFEFKVRWGAQAIRQPFWLCAARGAAPRLDVGDARLQMLVRLWRSLPRSLADALGPSICRRFLV